MADSLTKEERSKNMSSIKGKDTKPEMTVRKFLYNQGIRYRLHSKELPGKPDIVMRKRKTVIFVNGCYWHRHRNCKFAYTPKSNIRFWETKFNENIERDLKNYKTLKSKGWNVIVIWECKIKNNTYQEELIKQLRGWG